MTYQEAKKKIYLSWLIGAFILAVSSVSTVISALKMFYFGPDGGDQLSHFLAQPIKRLVAFIYQQTRLLEYFWQFSPQPTPKELHTSQNVYFLIGYLLIFVGLAYIGSARSLSARLAAIDKQIEDEMIKSSITGGRVRQREEIQNSIPIQKSGIFSQFHTLYLAPLVVGLIVAVIAKLTGLT
jgi:hypothetical protein